MWATEHPLLSHLLLCLAIRLSLHPRAGSGFNNPMICYSHCFRGKWLVPRAACLSDHHTCDMQFCSLMWGAHYEVLILGTSHQWQQADLVTRCYLDLVTRSKVTSCREHRVGHQVQVQMLAPSVPPMQVGQITWCWWASNNVWGFLMELLWRLNEATLIKHPCYR